MAVDNTSALLRAIASGDAGVEVEVLEQPVDVSRPRFCVEKEPSDNANRLLLFVLAAGDVRFKAIEYATLGDEFKALGPNSTLTLRGAQVSAGVVLLEPATCSISNAVELKPRAPLSAANGPPPFEAFVAPAAQPVSRPTRVVEPVARCRSRAVVSNLRVVDDALVFTLDKLEAHGCDGPLTVAASRSLHAFLVPPNSQLDTIVDKLRLAFVEKSFTFDLGPRGQGVLQIENIHPP